MKHYRLFVSCLFYVFPDHIRWKSVMLYSFVGVAVVACLAGCRRDAPKPVGAPWFEEVAAQAGIAFQHVSVLGQSQHHFPEIMGGGVCFLDFDNDGWLDLYFVQSGDLRGGESDPKRKSRLYRNRRDGTFEDVTDRAGVGGTGYGMGCACGDYDGDGDVDLFVTNVGMDVLYRNNGDSTFTEVTQAAGVGDLKWSTSAAFVDVDGDDDLDLFAVNYINWAAEREMHCLSGADQRDYCQPNNYNAPVPCSLYRNQGDGTFVEVGEEAGLRTAFGNGLGVACGDYNGDGRTVVFVANDGLPNQLWINQGGGRFVDEALFRGCAVDHTGVAEAGMGILSTDVNDDGRLDLFMTTLRNETNTLFVNRDGLFDDLTAARGLAASSLPYTGFGAGFADFDLDGDLDLYVANGRVKLEEPLFDPDDPYAEPNLLYEQREGRFEAATPEGGTRPVLVATSRGAAFGDHDNDGDIDVVVVNRDGPAHMLRNTAPRRGSWVMFDVRDERGRLAVGAMVRLRVQGKERWRRVDPAYSYLSSNDPRVHFGLGESASAVEVLVRWANGRSEVFGPYSPNRLYALRAGEGNPVLP